MMQLMIRQESDLYNPYDPTQTRINDGVYQYSMTGFISI